MKALRLFFFFIISLVLVTAFASFMLPTSQYVERTISINAPASEIYNQLKMLDNFNKYTVWGQRDSTSKFILSGKDGTVGAASTWTGDPEIAGDGKIEIATLEENKKIGYLLTFTKPKKGSATSIFELNEKNGITALTWKFELATPRPWNVFNLFYNMEKKVGKDFDEGLALIKAAIEKDNKQKPEELSPVAAIVFSGSTYALIRQTVQWNDITSFMQQHLPIITEEAQKQNITTDSAVCFIYNWDVKTQTADVAVACPVAAGSKFENNIIQVKEIEPSKAIATTFTGGYAELSAAYNSLKKYKTENELKEKSPLIEQFINRPSNEVDFSKWQNRLILLVD
ncbi:MAG: SRPBCC family protein [Bacteroidetes bacterium]|nr:SRPBCC family protein [Bacteroidota bacterium]